MGIFHQLHESVVGVMPDPPQRVALVPTRKAEVRMAERAWV